jgi:hypothetical protein
VSNTSNSQTDSGPAEGRLPATEQELVEYLRTTPVGPAGELYYSTVPRPAHVPSPGARPRVLDVTHRHPKTLSAGATVSEARELLANPRMRELLLVDGETCAGVLRATDIPASAAVDAPALDFARLPETIPPDATLEEAHRRLAAMPAGRLVVLDADERLLGLLCRNTRGTGFCHDQAAPPVRRERWLVVRAADAGDTSYGLLTTPEGAGFKLGEIINLPETPTTSRWLVVGIHAEDPRQGALFLEPISLDSTGDRAR